MKRTLLALAASLLIAPVALAGGQPGVAADTITIGGTVPITGPPRCSGPLDTAPMRTSST